MSIIGTHRRSLGINFSSRGEAEVLVWAPDAKEVAVVVVEPPQRIALSAAARGYHSCITPLLKPGDRYFIELDQDGRYGDPASHSQPEGIFGPSEVFNPNSFQWTDEGWHNISLRDFIIYELHVGTFTDAGDFNAIISKLSYLKDLGITAIELMPIAEFPGNRNWGYDGVFPYAAHHAYGGPRALQELVDACHAHGLAVVLDVVYNHLGPEGNNLGKFGPYFTDKYKTPWGQAINFDDAGCDEVRKYFIENALMWFRDFHVDALRLDAVHAIRDFSAKHILEELREHIDQLITGQARPFYLIGECDLNDPRYLRPSSQSGYGLDAQWTDEFHHALRVAAGKDPKGYYSDFKEFIYLGKAFKDAYVYDGQYSAHRAKTFGRKADNLSAEKFVVFSQNHDQVGNTMLGERTSTTVPFEMLKVLAAAVVCSPYVPLLFMGEEYAERQPFQYFVSHHGEDLVNAVRAGRKEEFASFFHDNAAVPDPQSGQTYQDSKLRWSFVNDHEQFTMLQFYKRLIEVRKQSRILSSGDRERLAVAAYESERCLVVHRWSDTDHIICAFNFSGLPHTVNLPDVTQARCIVNSGDLLWMGGDKHAPAYSRALNLLPSRFLLFSTQHV